MALTFNVAYDELAKFKHEVRKELWTGKMNEQEFWAMLLERFPTVNAEYAAGKLISEIKPMPCLEEIPNWSKIANIHLLSNHRTEWISHIIDPVKNYITSITISDETGFCKPEMDIYLIVHSKLFNRDHVLFVDDQEKNLVQARNLGWNTLLADEKGEWIKAVRHQLLD
ncbi:HAD family hydrolase [Paenibacillus gansuensis]|uniref:HAD family hydrolase n=1 Tax=Paenibacillus gansuensis TaxID=306542 RepID=A0ABW5PAE1_9BACL